MSIVGDIADGFLSFYYDHQEMDLMPNIFISPLRAYEQRIIDDENAPQNLSSKMVNWVKKSTKPIIASRSRIIAYAFSENLNSTQTNSLLQSYGFSSLYERAFMDASIIYALDTNMTIREWSKFYPDFLKDFNRVSKEKNLASKFGSKDLSDRDFFKYIVETGNLSETNDNALNQIAVGIYSIAHKKLIEEEIECSKFLENRIETIKVIKEKINDFFVSKTAISASIDAIPDIIRESVGVNRIPFSRADVYKAVANYLSLSSDDSINALYKRLIKNASSLLSEEELKTILATSEDFVEVYSILKPYFCENFSLQQLWMMMAKDSEMDEKNNLITLNFTNKNIRPELQNAIKNNDFAGFYYKFAGEMAEIRYKKRRYIIKYLHSMLRDRYLALLSFQENIIREKNLIREHPKFRDTYIYLAKDTLIDGLAAECGASSKKTENEDENSKGNCNKEEKQPDLSPFAIKKLKPDHKLTMDYLQSKPVKMLDVFYDFSYFCGYQNNMDRRFFERFSVFPFNEEDRSCDVGCATILLSMANETTLKLEYEQEYFIQYYHLENASLQEIERVFREEIAKCVPDYKKQTADNLRWLLKESRFQKHEKSLERWQIQEKTTESKSKKQVNAESTDEQNKKTNTVRQYEAVYKKFVNILNGKTDPSREFLLLFSVYAGMSKKEILEHMLPNVGYSTLLPKRRIFDRLISDLCQLENSEDRSRALNIILDSLMLEDDMESLATDNRIFGLNQILFDSVVGEELIQTSSPPKKKR